MTIKINNKIACFIGVILFFISINLYRRIENLFYILMWIPINIGASLIFNNIKLVKIKNGKIKNN
jgi:hypothetical protein